MKNFLTMCVWAFLVFLPLILVIDTVITGNVVGLLFVVASWIAGYHFSRDFSRLKTSYRRFRGFYPESEKDCPNCEVCECDLNSKI